MEVTHLVIFAKTSQNKLSNMRIIDFYDDVERMEKASRKCLGSVSLVLTDYDTSDIGEYVDFSNYA